LNKITQDAILMEAEFEINPCQRSRAFYIP